MKVLAINLIYQHIKESKKYNMRIGIFGGCFNPPHKMHKKIALELLKNNYLDKIIYVPTGDSYNKKDLISFKLRLEMVKLMIQDNDNLLISEIGNKKDYEYTYQILDYFKKIYYSDDIYFICGSDNLKEFSTWKNYKYILKHYKVLIVKRNNDNINTILSSYYRYLDKIIITNIKSEIVSSTYLRNNIATKNLDKYIDNKVYTYIGKNKIY